MDEGIQTALQAIAADCDLLAIYVFGSREAELAPLLREQWRETIGGAT